jgi:hypothetical protein
LILVNRVEAAFQSRILPPEVIVLPLGLTKAGFHGAQGIVQRRRFLKVR